MHVHRLPGFNLNAPIDVGAYAQTMATAAATYPGGFWEIMNEPDVVQPTLDRDWPNEAYANPHRRRPYEGTPAADAIEAI